MQISTLQPTDLFFSFSVYNLIPRHLVGIFQINLPWSFGHLILVYNKNHSKASVKSKQSPKVMALPEDHSPDLISEETR